jgi:hypothetical protein
MQRTSRPRPLPATCLALALLALLPGVSVGDARGPIRILATPAGSALEAVLELPSGNDAAAGRLLVFPAGTSAAEVIAASDGSGASPVPIESVHLGPIMIMRGTPVAPLWLDAPVAHSLSLAGVDRVVVRLRARGGESRSGVPRAPAAPGDGRPERSTRGGYLIVTADAYTEALRPLIDWKTACGYDVSTFRTSETGRTLSEIRGFVRTAYETWDIPPLYLLLVGDVEEIPSGDLLGNVTDHVYACIEGDDFLPDLYVGRFSAKNAAEVAVQVAKTVGYESRPEMTGIGPDDEETWFNRALMVAGNHGSLTPVPTCQWVGEELQRIGFARIYSVYYPPFSDGCSQTYGCPVGEAIDRGVSIVNYRGWARENPPGWDVPDYTTDDIVRLSNGWKLPFIFSIVCNTGDFGRPNEDCFGEGWLKAGTVDEPRGAVGFIGTAEHWSRTRWNDRIDLAIFETLCYEGAHQVGPILAAAKAALLAHFPTEIHLADVTGEEAVEFYAYIYNILADPSLTLWTARPRTVQAAGLPATITGGTNCVSVRVTEADGTTAVPDAHVAFVQDGGLIGYGMTDASGNATVGLDLVSSGAITCTVSGVDLHPWRATIAVVGAERALTCTGAEIVGSGDLVPGRIADVLLTVRNTGRLDLSGATATITAPPEVEVIDGTTEFGPIAAGATATALSPVRLWAAGDTENGVRLRFALALTAGGELLPATEFLLTTVAPDCIVQAMTDGDDGVFDPGEEFDLVLTLCNQGPVSGGALQATLEPPDPGSGATVIDAAASFAAIAPGGTADNAADPFVLRLENRLAAGTVIPLNLTITGEEGPVCQVSANLVVGIVDGGAPLGPDAYGYYAYDSADIDYRAQAPAYRWIEISPRYGGPGTRLAIDIDDRVPQVVRLPFPFPYYGQPYDSALVSDNGWIAFETAYYFDTRNWSMPDRWGGACQVAAFWDNLNPMAAGTDGIYTWHDAERHRFVIEWSRLRNFEESANHWQSFQIVLYDPAACPTRTGDGEIVFQYKQIVNDDWMTMYSTVGIEDQSETVGIQYSYSNLYPPGAVPLAPGLAIRFTTDAPVYDPIVLRRFEATWTAGDAPIAGLSPGVEHRLPGEVRVQWECDVDPAIAGFEVLRAATGADGLWREEQRVHAGLLPAGSRCFADSTADPSARYRYRLWVASTVGTGRNLGETVYQGLSGDGPLLRLVSANPSPTGAVMLMRPGRGARAEVIVYDAAGRRVRTLDGGAAEGSRARLLSWDGRDAGGRLVPSGLYWLRPATGAESGTLRLTILH